MANDPWEFLERHGEVEDPKVVGGIPKLEAPSLLFKRFCRPGRLAFCFLVTLGWGLFFWVFSTLSFLVSFFVSTARTIWRRCFCFFVLRASSRVAVSSSAHSWLFFFSFGGTDQKYLNVSQLFGLNR